MLLGFRAETRFPRLQWRWQPGSGEEWCGEEAGLELALIVLGRGDSRDIASKTTPLWSLHSSGRE